MTDRVGIVGHSGYSGAELLRILSRHSQVEPVLLDHREPAESAAMRRLHPLQHLECTSEAVESAGLALVFLATAAEVSMELAPVMLQAGARVVDLSGAFRLGTPERYSTWYRQPHTQPELLAEAVY